MAVVDALRDAVRALRSGGIVAYPTEAVWGLGCDPLDAAACQRLLALKQRPPDKGLILIAVRVEDLAPYIEVPDPAALARAQASWPGPHTWVFPAGAAASRWITGAHPSVAVRVTAHPIAGALCAAFGGALVSTSANRSGEPPARSAEEVQAQFGSGLCVLPGPTGGLAAPNPIRDALTGQTYRP
jgi:L-threonylcarbamoyladenylate synthase